MEQIGRYTIENLLARGGMAEVFVGSAQGPGGFSKKVVVKRILPDMAEDPTFVEMFLNEAKLAALLNHPNIVQVFDFGQDGGQYFLAMEYIEGESLRTVLRYFRRRQSTVPPRIAVQLIIGVCEGLHYAHGLADENGASYNIVHRDVTPDNILLSKNGIPKIVDFGIAKAMSNANKTQAGVIKGKYAYMPPEQIKGEALDRRLDVYALGIVLYELLAGRRPYQADSELGLLNEILQTRAPPITELNPNILPALAVIVERAIEKDPEKRYQDARLFQSDLEDFLAATGKRVGTLELANLCDEVSKFRKANTPGGASGPKSQPRGVPGLQRPVATPITLETAAKTEAPAPPSAHATASVRAPWAPSGSAQVPTPSNGARTGAEVPLRSVMVDLGTSVAAPTSPRAPLSAGEEPLVAPRRSLLPMVIGGLALLAFAGGAGFAVFARHDDRASSVSTAQTNGAAGLATHGSTPAASSASTAATAAETTRGSTPSTPSASTTAAAEATHGSAPSSDSTTAAAEATHGAPPTAPSGSKPLAAEGSTGGSSSGVTSIATSMPGTSTGNGEAAAQAKAPLRNGTPPATQATALAPPASLGSDSPTGPASAVDPLNSTRSASATRAASHTRRERSGGEGFLTLRTQPWCDVFVDGEKIGTTPLIRSPISSGRHTVVLRNDAEGALKKLSVDIASGKELKQAIVFPGH